MRQLLNTTEESIMTVLYEMKHAIQQLLRTPGFAVVALLTLCLGVGSTTAVFTLVRDVLLKPLPYRHADRMVVLEEQVEEIRDLYPTLPASANHFIFWQEHSHSIQVMALMRQVTMPLGGGPYPLQVNVLKTTPGIFSVINEQPIVGRSFSESDTRAGYDRVAILTYNLWREHFRGNAHIVGSTITLDGFPYTVIGIMPRDFKVPLVNGITPNRGATGKETSVLVPLVISAAERGEQMGSFNYFCLAQLKANVSVTRATAELNVLQHAISANLPSDLKGTLSILVLPYQAALIGRNRVPLLLLLVAVGGLLLSGCVNISSLLVARSISQRKKAAIAIALGARRIDLARMALREPVALGILGALLGVISGTVFLGLLHRYLPPALDMRESLHLDWVGVLFTLLVTIASALLAGFAPLWAIFQVRPQEILHSEERLAGESRSRGQMRKVLVAVEVGVSVTLVQLSGLLAISWLRLTNEKRGFDSDQVLVSTVNLPKQSYMNIASRTSFYRSVLLRLSEIPGVQSVGFVSDLPLGGGQWIEPIRIFGDRRPFVRLPTEDILSISPGYLTTIRLPLIAGRFFRADDWGKRYALISQFTARTLWAGASPMGKTFTLSSDDGPPFTVVGVVGNARSVSLTARDPMMVYLPFWYRNETNAGLVIRTQYSGESIEDTVRKTIWNIDPGVSVTGSGTLNGIIADSIASRRFELNVLILFAVSSVLLASLGIYGVVAFSTLRRQGEVGLRLAFGAKRMDIICMIIWEGLKPIVVGGGLGMCAALWIAVLGRSVLYAVSPYNVTAIITSASILIFVGIAATIIPACVVASVDPRRALLSD